MTGAPHVALSMLTLVPGGMGGSETYARELTRVLASSDAVAATAYVPEGAAGFSRGIPEVVLPGVQAGGSTVRRLGRLAAVRLNARRIRASMHSPDVVHFPFTVPAPPPARGVAFVQTLLDLQHLDLPDMFSPAELLYRGHFYEGAATKADIVITISEFARSRMINLLDLDPDRVRVAPLGVDVSAFVPNPGEREPFVLYPARGWPHKNHARLVEAMKIVRRDRPDLRLVLTGGGLEALGELPEWVERKGLVSAAELRELYSRASVMVFPSLYEGFGLPPLEAMASGCPVAASAVGSIPEVCDNAAVLFDPHDAQSIADGIESALTKASELYEPGLLQAATFSWERCRDVHVTAYLDAAL
jgi:glycosyltransferase involved in cell wall biosynthesis